MTPQALESEIRHIKESLMVDLSADCFVRIEKHLAGLIDNEELLGPKVSVAFPSVLRDAKEAGNCLATDCNTAAVFHLMRVAEIGLRALAKDRNVSYPHSSVDDQQCGTIITSLDSKLNALRGADKKLWPSEAIKNEQIRFYHSATIELRSFNEAWRKHVCHGDAAAFYDSNQALSIFTHVRAFMQLLASRITEFSTTPEYWTTI